MPIGAKLYQATAEDQKDSSNNDNSSQDDDAVEGEVVDNK